MQHFGRVRAEADIEAPNATLRSRFHAGYRLSVSAPVTKPKPCGMLAPLATHTPGQRPTPHGYFPQSASETLLDAGEPAIEPVKPRIERRDFRRHDREALLFDQTLALLKRTHALLDIRNVKLHRGDVGMDRPQVLQIVCQSLSLRYGG